MKGLVLGGCNPSEVRRLVVAWPSACLRALTLIDLPGIGSGSTDVSSRTHAFLAPEDGPTEADAVAVLSRADEIGVARLDALRTAERIARRYRTDPKVRRMCQTVVPVAGLLAEAGATLRQDGYGALQALLAVPRDELANALLSAQRFVSSAQERTFEAETRDLLLQRIGLFGVRRSLALLRHGGIGRAPEPAAALTKHSGIDRFREVLATRLVARAELLEARSALAGIDVVLRTGREPVT